MLVWKQITAEQWVLRAAGCFFFRPVAGSTFEKGVADDPKMREEQMRKMLSQKELAMALEVQNSLGDTPVSCRKFLGGQ